MICIAIVVPRTNPLSLSVELLTTVIRTSFLLDVVPSRQSGFAGLATAFWPASTELALRLFFTTVTTTTFGRRDVQAACDPSKAACVLVS
jgi:hypothetical protein